MPLTSLAVRFRQRADYPVVIATANRKWPTAGKAWGFVPVFAGSFLAWVRTLCPKLGQKIQRGASISFHARSFVRPPHCLLYQITLIAEYRQMLHYFSSLPMLGCRRPAVRCASQPLISLVKVQFCVQRLWSAPAFELGFVCSY